MTKVTLKGNPVQLEGKIPSPGDKAPDFKAIKQDLSEFSLKDYAGKVKILVAVPSLDTSVCALETKAFNEKAAGMSNVTTLVISGDLPFAMGRFCTTEGINSPNLITGSQYRDFSFSKAYGTHIADGPLKGLSARAVFVLDKSDTVRYVEIVPEITTEPNYTAAIAAANAAL
ncbi:lipid hydroperoxide peroxidase [Leptospira kirschneri serovar Pomona]|uniref:Thiol peroxidase n=1 Tax=Leptospira kirschneri serovar Pomona TaxID=561005 RepID=A0A1T1DJC3_9LEPT|nr:thiol peroxidase [Leptospira kirschneri]OOV40937.1 lipid hydroperoxide peroxidase [Leptospira kirschneri serovar Pomona]